MNNNSKLKKLPTGISVSDIQTFGIEVSDLRTLMKCQTAEAIEKLDKDYGGAAGLALRLNSDIKKGLKSNQEDLYKRQRFYGKNDIPPKAPKSIFVLAFEAIQETTLIMLMICAIISIGLSFYHPPVDDSEEVNITLLLLK